ncbi:hypothetical protein FB45DRAFT_6296 [Roridomyces roridus]|uniref:F-box domain-containing protein n=1 Tax=Roridomyces roridus TaxID=1738132 RepID=A0AAD7G1N0_9AGAR|nr:hypothetical protein FB45DRAFT_6296 [Roridomyces roridus]
MRREASTEGIEAQIAQVSLEIGRQKDVLRKLESSKSLLQQQLNAVRDPIARLPLEISSEIFLQCLPTGYKNLRRKYWYPRPRPHSAPLLLLNISHAWTGIALSTPALWASIHVAFSLAHKGSAEFLGMWLRRGGSRPLHLSITGVVDSLAVSAVLQHSPLESLAMSFGEMDKDDLGDLPYGCYDFLRGFQPQMELPSLQVLDVSGRTDLNCSWPPFRQLLCLSSNLVELDMEDVVFIDDSDEEKLDTLALPHLRRLKCVGDCYALDCISATRLEILCLSADTISRPIFDSFLRRSSPHLQKLQLRGSATHFHPHFGQCMALIPTLTQLEFSHPSFAFAKQLLDFLVHNPHLLPCLQILKVATILVLLYEPNQPTPSDILSALALVLSIRRNSLRTVRLTIQGSSRLGLPDDPLALFQEFLDDGMDIHIGV